MNSMTIVVPGASWSDVFSSRPGNPFLPGVPRSRKSRKKPATMHLQSPSLLSNEWGEVHRAVAKVTTTGIRYRMRIPKISFRSP